MKLNPDCFRDILLFVEENTGINSAVVFSRSHEHPLYEKYSFEEVFYHLNQCELSGYIFSSFSPTFCRVKDLTPEGHRLIADIRSDNVWNKTKEISKRLGVASLGSFASIAVNVVSDLISKSKL